MTCSRREFRATTSTSRPASCTNSRARYRCASMALFHSASTVHRHRYKHHVPSSTSHSTRTSSGYTRPAYVASKYSNTSGSVARRIVNIHCFSYTRYVDSISVRAALLISAVLLPDASRSSRRTPALRGSVIHTPSPLCCQSFQHARLIVVLICLQQQLGPPAYCPTVVELRSLPQLLHAHHRQVRQVRRR